MSNELIPFVIIESNPHYKRPYVSPFFGIIEEYKLTNTILEKLFNFVYDRIDIDSINDVEDIEDFWLYFYHDSYMDNVPWQAVALVNGIWKKINISNDELFERLMTEQRKNSIYISSDSENTENTEDSSESIIIHRLDINTDINTDITDFQLDMDNILTDVK